MSNRIIIDVREPFEFAMGHVDGALNIPPRELMDGSPQLASVPKDTELILYCRSGSRSRTAAMILAQQGFTNIVNGINQDYVSAHYL
jgi:phage shock protein E